MVRSHARDFVPARPSMGAWKLSETRGTKLRKDAKRSDMLLKGAADAQEALSTWDTGEDRRLFRALILKGLAPRPLAAEVIRWLD